MPRTGKGKASVTTTVPSARGKPNSSPITSTGPVGPEAESAEGAASEVPVLPVLLSALALMFALGTGTRPVMVWRSIFMAASADTEHEWKKYGLSGAMQASRKKR